MPNYEQDPTTKFVNPYNFIPLEDSCKKEVDYKKRKKEGKLTGWLNCKLETKTPIFIPNTTSVEENQKGEKISNVFKKEIIDEDGNKKIVNSYDFYSYEKIDAKKIPQPPEPVIPGSEIRGATRSAFEAVTNSCLSTIDKDQVLYKRTNKNGEPGRLIKTAKGWEIQPCIRVGAKFKDWPRREIKQNGRVIYNPKKVPYDRNLNSKFDEGEEVSVVLSSVKYTKLIRGNPKPLFHEVKTIYKGHNTKFKNSFDEFSYEFNGYFHQGESFQRKHHESIFIPTKEPNIPIDEDEALVNLLKNLKLSQNKSINLHYKKRTHGGYKKIGDADRMALDDLEGKLIYYNQYEANDGIKLYLSPAAIGREVFHNKLFDLIGDFTPCDNLENLCISCALFGLSVKGNAAASRIRFTDAKSDGSHKFSATKTLKELASPKISATEFYLKRHNGADIWNYDYAYHWQNNKPISIPEYQPIIKGRKFYWHQKNATYWIQNEKDVTDRNVHVRPLNDGKFSFKVYFNNITEQELNTLIWVLEIGGSPQHAHKIGMGKSIGLGSVQISVDDIQIRTLERNAEIVSYKISQLTKEQFKEEGNLITKDEKILKQFKKITNFEDAPANVSYPYNKGKEDESYHWFVANKGNSPMRPSIVQTLPEIVDENKKLELKGFREQERRQNYHNRGHNRRR